MKRLFGLYFFTVVAAGLLLGCKKEKSFTVTGTIRSSGRDTLFLEHRALAGVVRLDSVVLGEAGQFRFRAPASESPEFYQLRLGDGLVAFAVDSTETIQIEADAADLYGSFRVKGSIANDRMREVDRLVGRAAATLKRLEEEHKEGVIDDVAFMHLLVSINER